MGDKLKFNVFTGTFDLVGSGSSPPTSADKITFDREAAANLSGQRVVRPLGDGTVDYADQSNLAHRDGPFWLTMGAAMMGDMVPLLALGEFTEAGWNWTVPGVIFLGTAGALTQTPPTSGLLIQLAAADTPDSLFFDPDPSIKLAT